MEVTPEIIKLYQSVDCLPSPLELILADRYYNELQGPYLLSLVMSVLLWYTAYRVLVLDMKDIKRVLIRSFVYSVVPWLFFSYWAIAVLYWLRIQQQYC